MSKSTIESKVHLEDNIGIYPSSHSVSYTKVECASVQRCIKNMHVLRLFKKGCLNVDSMVVLVSLNVYTLYFRYYMLISKYDYVNNCFKYIGIVWILKSRKLDWQLSMVNIENMQFVHTDKIGYFWYSIYTSISFTNGRHNIYLKYHILCSV